MKQCLAILFNDIDKDSRVKRALSVLSRRYEVTLLSQRKSTDHEYPFRVITFGEKAGRIYQVIFSLYVLWIGLSKKYDVVYSAGLIALIPGALLKKLKIEKLIYDNRELYLKDEKGESTYGDAHRFIEKVCIKYADLSVAANIQRAAWVREHYGLGDRVTYVNNISDFSALPAVDLPPDFKFLEDTANKTIVYQGHLGNTRGLELFVSAMRHLPDNYHFLLIARGKGVGKIEQMMKDMGIDERLHVSDLLALDLLHAILKKCDVGVIPYPMLGPNNNYCAPNKLYEYAQSDLPMITTPQQTFLDVFEKYGVGRVVDMEQYEKGDSTFVASIIAKLIESPPAHEVFEAFNTEFSFVNESERLESYLDKYL